MHNNIFVKLNRLWNSFLGAVGFPVQRYVCFRPYVLPVVVGLCLGITIHMMLAPFMEEGCDVSIIRRAAARSAKLTVQSSKSFMSHSDIGNDDFEARIVKPIPSNATKTDKQAARPKIVRPRYISTELGIREKLFVAVLTSGSTVDKLGLAFDKTLSKYVTKVIFFSTVKPAVIPNGLPMVAFGDKHPELLPIHILRYIQEHYADTFDFYLFLSDRTYLRAEKYFDLVEHISVKDDVHMGVPGVEKNFCTLEGGVLLSQSVMTQVLGNLDWCMKNIHPDNPSVTLGRCVHHTSQKLCTPKGGDQTLKYTHLQDFDYDNDISQLKREAHFNQSLAFYPMPDDISHYKLHRYFCYVDLNETRHEIETAKKDIIDLSQHSPGGRDSLTWPIGVPAPYKPANRFSIIQWTYFTETHIYLDNELTNMKEISGADKLDIVDIKQTAMENLDRKYHSQFKLKKILNGYRRFDPTRGMEYTMDLLLMDKHHQNAETIKRVHLVRPLGKVELVPMPYVTENMMVNIILPLRSQDVGLFQQFLDSYVRTCLQSNEDVRLIVALLYSNVSGQKAAKDLFAKPKSLIGDYDKKYNTKGKLSWKALQNIYSDITVIDQLQGEFQTDSLILMSTVNTEMAPDVYNQYLNRVRMNTIKGKQVFFPMGFWQYKPNLIYNKKPYPTSVEIGQRLGHFSTDLFDHSSFYTSDYKTARKTLSPSAVKTGDIFNMFITYKNFHIFRAVEPNLKLKWMNLTCDPTVSASRYQQCVTHNLDGLASQHHLALLIYEERREVISQQGAPPKSNAGMAEPKESDKLSPLAPKFAPVLKPHQANIDDLLNDPQAEGMLLIKPKKKL